MGEIQIIMPQDGQTKSRELLKGIVKEALIEVLLSTELKTRQASTEEDVMLTRKEAMTFLKIGATKLNELRQNGHIRPIRLHGGGQTTYWKKDLIEYCESRTAKILEVANDRLH